MPTTAVILVCFVLLVPVSSRNAFRAVFPETYPAMVQNGVDPGQPLFLTPYLQKGQPQVGQ